MSRERSSANCPYRRSSLTASGRKSLPLKVSRLRNSCRASSNSRAADCSPRELERRRVAPYAIDLFQGLLELAAERAGFARGLLQHAVDGFHRGVGSLQERAEACASGLHHAAQDLALRAHLHPQILEFALLLYARGDVGHTDHPQARLVRGMSTLR